MLIFFFFFCFYYGNNQNFQDDAPRFFIPIPQSRKKNSRTHVFMYILRQDQEFNKNTTLRFWCSTIQEDAGTLIFFVYVVETNQEKSRNKIDELKDITSD